MIVIVDVLEAVEGLLALAVPPHPFRAISSEKNSHPVEEHFQEGSWVGKRTADSPASLLGMTKGKAGAHLSRRIER